MRSGGTQVIQHDAVALFLVAHGHHGIVGELQNEAVDQPFLADDDPVTESHPTTPHPNRLHHLARHKGIASIPSQQGVGRAFSVVRQQHIVVNRPRPTVRLAPAHVGPSIRPQVVLQRQHLVPAVSIRGQDESSVPLGSVGQLHVPGNHPNPFGSAPRFRQRQCPFQGLQFRRPTQPRIQRFAPPPNERVVQGQTLLIGRRARQTFVP